MPRETAMSAIKTEAAPYLDAFRADASEPSWLADHRRAALTAFGERGFPSRREEAWRFTNLRPLTENIFPPPRRTPGSTVEVDTGLRRYGAEGIEGAKYRLVFLNGMLQSGPTDLPKGVWLASMARTIVERPDLAKQTLDPSDLAGGQPFASLNAALFADGFVLALEPGVTLDRPVEIIHIAETASAASIHSRNAILLGAGAKATLMETYLGTGAYWTNAATEVAVGDGAALAHIQLQAEDTHAIHLTMARAKLAKNASYQNFGLTLGANLSRRDVQIALGEGASCAVNGAYLLRGEQDTTNAIFIDHAAPGATTRELFKGVLDERAHGAFLGTIAVRQDAQKTDAQQTSRTLLLSDRAAIDTKPELDILADDVKCSHGAAVGDLDKDMLFYLRARGIGADEARRMLIEAFVLDAIETVEQPEFRAHLSRHIRRWLGREEA
jgi:Fe-S cluster assembly protein SufD